RREIARALLSLARRGELALARPERRPEPLDEERDERGRDDERPEHPVEVRDEASRGVVQMRSGPDHEEGPVPERAERDDRGGRPRPEGHRGERDVGHVDGAHRVAAAPVAWSTRVTSTMSETSTPKSTREGAALPRNREEKARLLAAITA